MLCFFGDNADRCFNRFLKYLHIADLVYYAVLVAATLVVLVLSPVEDMNKPLDEIEHKIYKKRAIFIAAMEILIGLAFKLAGLNDLFVAVVFSFATLCFMLVAGKVKNFRLAADFPRND